MTIFHISGESPKNGFGTTGWLSGGEKKSLISIARYNETVKVMKENIGDYLLECILELENFLSVKPKK